MAVPPSLESGANRTSAAAQGRAVAVPDVSPAALAAGGGGFSTVVADFVAEYSGEEHGRRSHSHAPPCTALVMPHTEHTEQAGVRENDFTTGG
jgi:hypothetical protein